VSSLSDFLLAAERYPRNGPHLQWSIGAREAARTSLRDCGLLLLGEVHGVAENPLIIERVVGELGIKTIALEWPRGLEAALANPTILEPAARRPSRDVATGPPSLIASVAWCGDGRVTAGHFAMLRRASATVVAVDEPIWPPGRDGRDAAIAANVEAALGELPTPLLFAAGNMHTRLSAHEHYVPAGALLRCGRPRLCALDIHYRQGGFWNLEPKVIEAYPALAGPRIVLHRATEAVVLQR
jgi:hypothetical protein